MIEIKNRVYQEIYDSPKGLTIPVVSAGKSPTVNNINLSGLKSLIADKSDIWGEESKEDFRDLLENEPSSKEFITIGEIILSPSKQPEHYYYIKQMQNSEGKTYISVTRCIRTSKFAPKTSKSVSKHVVRDTEPVKPKRHRRTKKEMEEAKSEQIKQAKQSKKSEQTNRTKKTKQLTLTSEKPAVKKEKVDPKNLDLEFFLCMKMRDALDEYISLKYSDQKRLLRNLKK